MQFLYCCYAFNKNFLRLRTYAGEEGESTESEDSEQEDKREALRLS
jgi:hypothetical protein